MSAVTSNGVHYQRIVYVDVDNISFDTLAKLLEEDYIEYTGMGTREISSYDIKRLEDDVQAQASLTEDEHGEYTEITLKELEEFKESIGTDVYDALLQEEIDIIILVSE